MHHTSKVSWLKARFNFYCHFSKPKLTQLLDRADFCICFVFLVCNDNQKVICTADFSIVPCSAEFSTIHPVKSLNNLHTKISKMTWSDFQGFAVHRASPI